MNFMKNFLDRNDKLDILELGHLKEMQLLLFISILKIQTLHQWIFSQI